MGTLVTKLLLPTISSLAFLPTISIAAKRRFHMEAMVYLFTMFFIAIYHACNGPGLSVLCFMRYDILEYFSIYGTALSMWVSLMALAEFDEPKRSTFVMFGVLTIAVRIYQDRWGYGVYSGPIGTAVLIIAAKWLQKMKEKKGLYPDKSVYTQQIGPGFCFGALALMLRFFFEAVLELLMKPKISGTQRIHTAARILVAMTSGRDLGRQSQITFKAKSDKGCLLYQSQKETSGIGIHGPFNA
uniref:Myomaker, myoblast fusion factor n=1 Tax=Sarcophilus harrisii TaxID=9305 RepID=A0A7N4UXY2_SARHA